MEKEGSFTFKELEELTEVIKRIYGYDFSGYAKASLKRRVTRILNHKNLSLFSLKNKLVNDKAFFVDFVDEITVNVTEMFRDPTFFRAIREEVLPYLESYPHIKIWNAGCATGEETYSFAIQLLEANLFGKSFIYGTDISQYAMNIARNAIYDASRMKLYSENYLLAGGKTSLSDYYTAKYDAVCLVNMVRNNILFSSHNLATDAPFNEFQLVSCRNVLIYFEPVLQDRVLTLLYNSLSPLGFLCLGSKETLRFSMLRHKFRIVNQKENIYQKID